MKKIFILIALVGVGFLSCRKMVLRDVDVNLSDQHCSNYTFDADELGLDCGGANCDTCDQTDLPCSLVENQIKISTNGVTLSTKSFSNQQLDTSGGSWSFTGYTNASDYLSIYFSEKPSVTQVYTGVASGTLMANTDVYIVYHQPSTFDLIGSGDVFFNYYNGSYIISSCDYTFHQWSGGTPSFTQSFTITVI